jgi:coatomer subunit beta
MSTIRESLGELPLATAIPAGEVKEGKEAKDKGSAPTPSPASVSTRVLADGTYLHEMAIRNWLTMNRYATRSAFTEVPATGSQGNGIIVTENNQQLRSLLVNGDFFLGTVLASTLSKLALRAAEVAFTPSFPFFISILFRRLNDYNSWISMH